MFSPATLERSDKMFYKHNDSLKRRTWLGIGEALLAAHLFGMLYLAPSVSFGKFRSGGPSAIQDLARFFSELIIVGFFALAVSLHIVIPVGALLGFLLPKVAVKFEPLQAFLIGSVGGATLGFGGAVLMGLAFGPQSVTSSLFWSNVNNLGQQLAGYSALWIGLRLAHLSKQIRAEKS
jgi:hypothetical protein